MQFSRSASSVLLFHTWTTMVAFAGVVLPAWLIVHAGSAPGVTVSAVLLALGLASAGVASMAFVGDGAPDAGLLIVTSIAIAQVAIAAVAAALLPTHVDVLDAAELALVLVINAEVVSELRRPESGHRQSSA